MLIDCIHTPVLSVPSYTWNFDKIPLVGKLTTTGTSLQESDQMMLQHASYKGNLHLSIAGTHKHISFEIQLIPLTVSLPL